MNSNELLKIVEQLDGVGRAILMDKYELDGATYWAGYSTRSETVYISVWLLKAVTMNHNPIGYCTDFNFPGDQERKEYGKPNYMS